MPQIRRGGQRITLFSVYFANKLPYPRGGGEVGKGVIQLYNVRKFSGLGAMAFLTQLMTVLSSEIRNLGYSMNQKINSYITFTGNTK